MSKESDHIHIIALAKALNVPILVEYMDRGEGGTVNNHVFPEGSEPHIFLLYRPGHYDILYKWYSVYSVVPSWRNHPSFTAKWSHTSGVYAMLWLILIHFSL